MRIAALILGIVGGLFGLGSAILVVILGGVAGAMEAEGAEVVAGLGFVALPVALLGLIGGALAMAKPTLAGIFMLISAVVGFILISVSYIIAAVLLLVGGILAIVARKQVQKTTPHMTA